MCGAYINFCLLKYTLMHTNNGDFLIYILSGPRDNILPKSPNLLSSIILVIDSQSMDCIADGFGVHQFKP